MLIFKLRKASNKTSRNRRRLSGRNSNIPDGLFYCAKENRMNMEKYSDPTAERAIANVMREKRMLKSCKYCGKIHDRKIECRQKKETLKKYREK